MVAAGFFAVRVIQSRSLVVWTAAYVENNLVAKPAFRAYAAPELNSCPDLLDAASSHESMSAFRGLVPDSCPEAWEWMLSLAGSPLGWLLSDPLSFIKNFAWDMWWLRFPNPVTLADAGSQGAGPLLVAVVLSIVGAVCGLCLPSSVMGRFETSARTAIVLSGALAGFFAYGAAMWASDGMEVARHMMPVTLLTPLVLMVMVAFLAARAKPALRLNARAPKAQQASFRG